MKRLETVLALLVVGVAAWAGVTRVQLARQQRTLIKGQTTILIPGINNTMLVSGAQSGGKEFKSHERCTSKDNGFYPGKPCGPPRHVHLNQEESFKVLSGKMGYFWENETGTAEVGEVLTIPAGVRHTFFSADPEQPLEFEVTLRPAAPFEQFIHNYYGQVVDAGSPDKVNPIQMLLMFEAGGMTIADIPAPVWLLITKVVLPFARLLGYQAFYPEYY